MSVAPPSFDARELRQVLGTFVTDVTVITALDANGKPHGLTANSFSSVSLDPPLVLWSQSLAAPSHPVFREVERFVVNILSDDQVDVSRRFARGGDDKFAGFADLYGSTISAASVPVFDASGAMVLALTAIGASDRLDLAETSRLVSGLRRCAATLGQRLAAAPTLDTAETRA